MNRKLFLVPLFLLIYVIFINSADVKAFLAKSKVGKVFRIFRRAFWAVVFLAFFWWFSIEPFIALVEFNNWNTDYYPVPERLWTVRSYKTGGIMVYAEFEEFEDLVYPYCVYYMPSKLEWLING